MHEQTIIYLIRHGDVVNPDDIVYGRKFNVPLSDLGRKQIHRIAERIHEREERPIILFSSPLRRTRESSQIISDFFQSLPIEIDDRLIETGAPRVEGKPMAWFTAHPDPYNDPECNLECPQDIIARMEAVFQNTKERYRGCVSCLVSHGDPLQFLMWSLTHTGENIPSIVEIGKLFFLKRSEGWRLVVNGEGKPIKYDRLVQDLIE